MKLRCNKSKHLIGNAHNRLWTLFLSEIEFLKNVLHKKTMDHKVIINVALMNK